MKSHSFLLFGLLASWSLAVTAADNSAHAHPVQTTWQHSGGSPSSNWQHSGGSPSSNGQVVQHTYSHHHWSGTTTQFTNVNGTGSHSSFFNHAGWASTGGNSGHSSFQHSYLINGANQQSYVGGGGYHHQAQSNNGGSGAGSYPVLSLLSGGQSALKTDARFTTNSFTASGSLLSSTAPFTPQPGSTAATTVPTTNSAAQQQITAVINADFASWTGSTKNSLTVSEVGQLLSNAKVTGSQAAVLGMIADLMNINIGNSSNPSYSPTMTLAQVNSFMGANLSYYTQTMSQVVSATKSNGTFSLYGSFTGPQLSAIQQAAVGNCYLISAIDSVLNQNPQLVTNMIVQNANGTFTVSFPGGTKETVSVTQGEVAQFSFATNNGGWLAVMGMAEAQVLTAQPAYSYTAAEKATPLGIVVNGGYPTQTLGLLTGQTYSTIVDNNKTQYTVSFINQLLTTDLANKTPIGVESTDHALAITGFNASTQTVTILNPWGTSGAYGYAEDPGVMNRQMNVTMVNGVFTLTTTQMLQDFYEITAQTSIINQVAKTVTTSGAKSIIGANPIGGGSLSLPLSVNISQSGTPQIAPNYVSFGSLSPAASSSYLLGTSLAQSNMITAALTTLTPDSVNVSAASSSVQNADEVTLSSDSQIDSLQSQSDFLPVSTVQYANALSGHISRNVKVRSMNDQPTAQATGAAVNEPVYQVGQGSLLVMHDKPIHIGTERAIVHVAPHAAAFIIQLGKDAIINTLADNHAGDVSVDVAGRRIVIPMGRALIVTDVDKHNQSSLRDLFSVVGMQQAVSLGNYGDTTALLGRISYVHALKNCPQFRQFMRSQAPEEHKIAMKLMKAGAASCTITGQL